jgi:hypothetical protein
MTSQTMFSVLEVIAAVLGLTWYYRNCEHYPHTALVLAFLPLFFAWRSNWNYFYYADIVLLAVILVEASDSNISELPESAS